MQLDTIANMDALEYARTLPDDSVHCCITSPPYYGLRQYLFDGAVIIDPGLSDEKRAELLRELEDLGIHAKF